LYKFNFGFRLFLGFATLLVTMATDTDSRSTQAGAAPEIARPGLQWFNVAAPIPIANLRGRLVILDFWTEGCINCIHIIPTLRRLEQRYPDKVVVIGVHSPKFAREKDASSVKDAIRRYEINHPVIHDPKMTIWTAYGVHAWPTLAIVAPDGSLLGLVPGEPDRDKLIDAIGDLVAKYSGAGSLQPARLEIESLPQPKGHFLYPGKLKPVSVKGSERRWALADGGHNQIVLLDDQGREVRRFGSGEAGLLDGPAGKARFNHPQGLIASTDSIFVADTDNHAIRRIDLATTAVTTLAGTGQRGFALREPGPARATALTSPWDLEKEGDQLFFANAGSHQIGWLDLKTGTVGRLAGSGAENLTSGVAAEAALAQPSGLSLSADGKTLYFTDSESSAVRAVSLGLDRQVTTLVGAGLFDFGWVNGDFNSARLQHPLGLAVDGDRVLVADTYNSAIRVLDLPKHRVLDFDDAFTCMDSVCLPTREPAGVVVADSDRILLVDTGNHRIEEYRVSTKSYHTWSR
jgi:thiol-disulfide isomerase/thioredoxin/DNA-binding beta-propeller fold protein YncE